MRLSIVNRALEESGNGCNSCSGRGGCLGRDVPIGDLPAAADTTPRLGATELKRELSKSSPDYLVN